MNYIDYKCTVWVRLKSISDADLDIATGMLKAGHLPSELPNDIDCDVETLLETEEFIVPSQNGGNATYEVFDSEGNVIMDNSKSKKRRKLK